MDFFHYWRWFYQHLISRNAVKIVQRLLRFAVRCRQNSLPSLRRNSLSSLAAIGHHAVIVFTLVAVICLVVTRFFSFVAFGCQSPSAATKDWHLVGGWFRADKVAFIFIANEIPFLLQLSCMMKSKASECCELSEKKQVNQKVLRHNKAIKVMHYTRQFWSGVRCALLVQWGTPYGRRYVLRKKNCDS